jgi:DNA polymerase-3 subunit delta
VRPPVYLLTGHEFLIEERLRSIREAAQADPLAEVGLDARAPVADMLAALETPSLLGGTRLVVIHDVESLDAHRTEALTAYLRSPSPHSLLVLVGGGRTRLAGAVRDVGEVVALEAPRGRRLVGWIRQRGRGRALRLDDRAAWALIDSVGPELRDLDGALDQLQSAVGSQSHITAAEVRRVFPRLADERIYAFTDAVGDRRLQTAMEALRRLLEQGDEPLVLFGALAAQVRRMLVARSVGDGGPRALRDALGLSEWRAERLVRQARSYREEELASAMSVLAATDVDMKSGELPPEVALERALITIVESPSGGRSR